MALTIKQLKEMLDKYPDETPVDILTMNVDNEEILQVEEWVDLKTNKLTSISISSCPLPR